MAKNYTFAEAVEIINEGKNLEAIADIGRRFPILLHKVTLVTAKAGEAFVDLMSYMPEHLTANKVNTAMKSASSDDTAEAEDDEDEAPAKEAKKAAPKAKTEAGETETGESEGGSDWASMNSNALYQELKKRGLTKGRKFSKKADMIEALEQYEANGGATAEEEANEAEDEAAEATNAYDGKSAMELFKECKKRGIKVAPKKPAKFYADLLVKNDAENTEAEEAEDDDWDEEPKAEAKEPKKSEKKPEKKSEKKPAKKAEAEDEDDDWDI